jgi:hypothetical protein
VTPAKAHPIGGPRVGEVVLVWVIYGGAPPTPSMIRPSTPCGLHLTSNLRRVPALVGHSQFAVFRGVKGDVALLRFEKRGESVAFSGWSLVQKFLALGGVRDESNTHVARIAVISWLSILLKEKASAPSDRALAMC